MDKLTMAEVHYNASAECLMRAEKIEPESLARTNELLHSIAHALLGGLRDGLDYAAKQREEAQSGSAVYPGPLFEEDDTRP